jgi:hypothetical protein
VRGTGPVDVEVDFAELSRVERELATLVAEVADLDGLCAITADGGQVGSDVVARNVGWFGGRWAAGRRAVSHNLGGCQEYVADALESYEATERMLLSGAVGPGASAFVNPERSP